MDPCKCLFSVCTMSRGFWWVFFLCFSLFLSFVNCNGGSVVDHPAIRVSANTPTVGILLSVSGFSFFVFILIFICEIFALCVCIAVAILHSIFWRIMFFFFFSFFLGGFATTKNQRKQVESRRATSAWWRSYEASNHYCCWSSLVIRLWYQKKALWRHCIVPWLSWKWNHTNRHHQLHQQLQTTTTTSLVSGCVVKAFCHAKLRIRVLFFLLRASCPSGYCLIVCGYFYSGRQGRQGREVGRYWP